MIKFLVICSSFVWLASDAQPVEVVWAKRLGGPYSGACHGYSVNIDNSDNIYLGGLFQYTTDFNPGSGTANLETNGDYGGYLAKYDSAGNYIWAFRVGKHAYSILLDDSFIYVGGDFDGKQDFDPGSDTAYLTATTPWEPFVAKYTKDGNYVWAKRLAGSWGINIRYYSHISVDKSGNVLISGQFDDTAYFNNLPDSNFLVAKGEFDPFFAKYDFNGNLVWYKSIEGTEDSRAHIPSITTDDQNNVYITGEMRPGFAYDFDPGPDTFYLQTQGQLVDGFMAKYDAGGNLIWAKAFDGLTQMASHSIAIDRYANIHIAGSAVDNVDMDPDSASEAFLDPVPGHYTPFFAKYDSAGNYIMAKKITSYGTDEIYSIKVDSSGKIAVAGYFTDSMADFDPGPDTVNLVFQYSNINGYDAFWAIYDSSGNYISAQSMYGNRLNIAHDVALYGNTLLVTGKFEDTTYFDNNATVYTVSKSTVPYLDNTFFAKYQLDFTNGMTINGNKNENIKIYPNPGSGKFTIEIMNDELRMKNFEVKIYNILGEKILQHSIFVIHNSTFNIDISTQPSGIYFYQISNGEKTYSGKMVIER